MIGKVPRVARPPRSGLDRPLIKLESIKMHMTQVEIWIRERAYAIWEIEGRPQGRERQHWEQATREVMARGRGASTQPAPTKTAAPSPARSAAAKPKSSKSRKSAA